MAEFVEATHDGVEGTATLSKEALDAGAFPGWKEVKKTAKTADKTTSQAKG